MVVTESNESPRLARWVHWSLLGGVALSGVLLSIGLILSSAQNRALPPGAPRSFTATVRLSLHGNGNALIYLGLFVLMATPVVRVAVLAVGWALAGEYRFAAVSGLVLALLGLAVVLGLG
jgi:hypothetical protein